MRFLLSIFPLISVFSRLAAADGILNITAQPLWISYGENATITFIYTPPCTSMSIFRKYSQNRCNIGSNCVNNPSSGQVFIDPSGTSIRFTGQGYTANDMYWGVCSDTITIYKTIKATGSWNNLNIGVKPKVLSVEIDPPDLPPTSLNRTSGPNGDIFSFDGTIDLHSGDSQIAIGVVGRGLNPNPLQARQDFEFKIPEFAVTNGTFSFIKPDSQGPSNFPIGDFPAGYRYRYHFNRDSLVHKGICSISATAVATLAHQTDSVPFTLNFSFDPIISDIEVIQVNDTVKYPYAKPGDCLFTCNAAICPHTETLIYDWSFYATFQPTYTNGNLADEPHRFLINATDCRDLYSKIVRNRLESEYHVSCRVATSTSTGQPTDKQVRFFDLLNPFLSTTTAKYFTIRQGGDEVKGGEAESRDVAES